MASTSRRSNTALEKQLTNEGWRFEFFQAVRLLEHIARQKPVSRDLKPLQQVGHSSFPHEEVVRFRALAERSFPSGSIARIDFPEPDEDNPRPLPQMRVAFMGLTGPKGVLPEHYLEWLIERRRQGDDSMRDFFDLFNHRTISLFYRAWTKYRLPVSFERARLDQKKTDAFTQTLESLVGLGTTGLKDRLQVNDQALLYFSGHFAHAPRTASALRSMIASVFKVPVTIEQFKGRWLTLDPDECSQFPSQHHPDGQFNQLGINAMIGSRVWDVQGAFGIRLGPMKYATFSALLPNASRVKRLISLARAYVGAGLEMEIQLVLEAAEVPACQLAADGDFEPRLGWNTWLTSKPMASDCDDVSFMIDDLATAQ